MNWQEFVIGFFIVMGFSWLMDLGIWLHQYIKQNGVPIELKYSGALIVVLLLILII